MAGLHGAAGWPACTLLPLLPDSCTLPHQCKALGTSALMLAHALAAGPRAAPHAPAASMGCCSSRASPAKHAPEGPAGDAGGKGAKRGAADSPREQPPTKAPTPISAEARTPAAAAAPAAKPVRPRLDPKDFQFKNRKGEVLVKAPGWVLGRLRGSGEAAGLRCACTRALVLECSTQHATWLHMPLHAWARTWGPCAHAPTTCARTVLQDHQRPGLHDR